MDRDILRMVLIGAGIILIVVLYVWDRFRRRAGRDEFSQDDFDREMNSYSSRSDDLDDPLFDAPVQRHRLPSGDEVIIRGARRDTAREEKPVEASDAPAPLPGDGESEDSYRMTGESTSGPDESGVSEIGWQPPELLQFAVVANTAVSFEGPVLASVFADLHLQYGDMGIYHFYDQQQQQKSFSIATMVEPGTFPEGGMEDFSVPGLMLFMQPRQLNDPLSALDQLIITGRELAVRLDGVLWDGNRKPLTDETIERLEEMLTRPGY